MAAKVQSYVPTSPAGSMDADALARYVFRELQEISRALSEFTLLKVAVLHAAPDKPREGMIVYADGTHWNPGLGVGFYGYVSGAWSKLSA